MVRLMPSSTVMTVEASFAEAPRPHRAPLDADPLIAVIVTTYGQPQFLADAVGSALSQTLRGIRVVIVNDGCPNAATHDIGMALAERHPGAVHYLRTANRGVAAARNTGLRFALGAWPTVKAVFPLDGDNMLEPGLLEHLWTVLGDAGWAYPDLEMFGLEDRRWEWASSFSPFRQHFENQSDAGSLIHRRVFDAGLLYDEDMRAGYEDWEFFLRAARHGYSGVHGGATGLRYRRHGPSMLADARRSHHEIYDYMRLKHAQSFKATSLTALEHRDQPRFVLVALDLGHVAWLTAPAIGPSREQSWAEFLAMIEPATHPYRPGPYVPPVLVLGTGAAFAMLERLKLLPGLLLQAQRLLGNQGAVAITVDAQAPPDGLEIEVVTSPRPDAVTVAVAVRTKTLADRLRWKREEDWDETRHSPAVHVRIGRRLWAGGTHPRRALPAFRYENALHDLALALHRSPEPNPPLAGHEGQASHAAFASTKQLDRFDTTFPWASPNPAGRTVTFVSGQPDRWTREVARALVTCGFGRALLVVTGSTSVDNVSSFDAVTIVARPDPDLLITALASADTIINIGSRATHEVLPMLFRQWQGRYTSCEGLELRWLDRKIAVPSAPTIQPSKRRPSTPEVKAQRRFGPARPVRLLVAGGRATGTLADLAARLRARNVPFELEVLLDSATDAERARLHDEADIVIVPSMDPNGLLSTWDAMAFANVVLIPQDRSRPDPIQPGRTAVVARDAAEIADAVAAIASDASGCREMRQAAHQQASARTWTDALRPLFLP